MTITCQLEVPLKLHGTFQVTQMAREIVEVLSETRMTRPKVK